ncbi:MAG TPA: hypothetical protein VFE32_13095 [Puia sp.]|jgi:hypothetical protein|nr:hypothetical protein [Puia sp.]
MCNNPTNKFRLGKLLLSSMLLMTLVAAGGRASAQHVRDTMAVIRDFNDIMAFAVQPYVYYSSTTSMMTGPMRNGRDSVIRLHGKFYKVGDDMYYGTEAEELFVQDSLMIRIDHERKAITVQRIDMATKKDLDLLPLKGADRQRLLRGRYLISELPEGGDTGVIVIRTQASRLGIQVQGAEMRVEFRKGSHLPLLMQVTVHIRQDGSEQVREALKGEGYNVERMQGNFNGMPCLVMEHTAAVRFDNISMDREQAQQMPLWTAKLVYDRATGEWTGAGDCAGYTVTKLF